MVTLKNTTKVAKTYNIPCRPGCEGKGCLCSVVTTQLLDELSDGTKGVRIVERRLPGALTILAGQACQVEDWVAESGVIKAAVARGHLRLVKG